MSTNLLQDHLWSIIPSIVIGLVLAVCIYCLTVGKRRKLQSLKWPPGSPGQFCALCSSYLKLLGWAVTQPMGPNFDIVATLNGKHVFLCCRAKGYRISSTYLEDVHVIRMRHKLPKIYVVAYDPISPEIRQQATGRGITLLRYTDLHQLRLDS